MAKRLALCFSGHSNSGKTTLVVKIADYLINKGFKVAIVKHDPKDKAVFDTAKNEFGEPKDSAKFVATGANVAVLSPKRTSVFLRRECEKDIDLSEIVGIFGDFDYLLIEGLKTLPLPRISVMRDEVDDAYIAFSDAFATNVDDERLKVKFGLDDIENIVNWIDNNAKRM